MSRGMAIPPVPDRERAQREARNRRIWRAQVADRHQARSRRQRSRRQWAPPPMEWDEWEDDQ